MKKFLITTARYTFVKGYYDSNKLLTNLSTQLNGEKNREAIFNLLKKELDSALQVEQIGQITANLENEQLRDYSFSYSDDQNIVQSTKLPANHPIISLMAPQTKAIKFSDLSEENQKWLTECHFGNKSVLIPFSSPEHLEGVILLGDRSGDLPYREADFDFFSRLINHVSALLYRLTPYEKLEQHYFSTKQKLHDAELQILRQQKIESILYTTNQCHHELRTPLNIIKQNTRRLTDVSQIDAHKKVINEEIERAIFIMNETLAITNGSNPTQKTNVPFKLNDAIQRSLKLVAGTSVKTVTDFGELPLMTGNFSDMEIVFTNLMNNAREAMPSGGTVSIKTFFENNEIVARFSDSGKGISDEMKTRVWEPYVSGSAALIGHSASGRGWGLTIVNRIVGEHKGTISFDSTVDEGTIFTLRFPVS